MPSTGRTITRANVADFMYNALMNKEYENTIRWIRVIKQYTKK